MNAACKQWWQDHSDELTEWDWNSFRRVWEAAQLSVVAPSALHNIAMVPCSHEWSFYIAHPPVEECKLCGSLRKAQHQ